MRERLVAGVAFATIIAGLVAAATGSDTAAARIWAAGAVVVLIPLTVDTARSLAHGDVGVDAIALVAIVWALLLGEELAAAIVALMMAGGGALEAWAAGRAHRELRLLVERAPSVAHRYEGSRIAEVGVEVLEPGDVVVIRAGEVVPTDGVVASGVATIDESALTGEPLPVRASGRDPVRSGTTNAGDAFDLRVTRPAAESAYAGIVRLVTAAGSDRSRLTRIADRYAALFLPFSLAVAGVAWVASGDATRGLAVMVVATPCPLILAAPIAFVAGLSRAARVGIIVKGAEALERLGGARTVLLDKTGTLTVGAPQVERIDSLGSLAPDAVLALAASLDQMSAHVVAESLVEEASRRGLELRVPLNVEEDPGRGIVGVVDGRRIAVGSTGWLASRGYTGTGRYELAPGNGDADGVGHVLVGVDGALEGVIVVGEELRPGAETLVAALHGVGVEHVALVSGDRPPAADRVARAVGIDDVYADQSPEDKVEVVRRLRDLPGRRNVAMVGDGINDAPALALADVGIAVAGKGATVSSETADAVITIDSVDRIPLAISIGRRSLGIARQSIVYGLGASVVAMSIAALGYLPPVSGALLQEVIDVAVILNALRALRG
jgi:heavy metal translocating P-type ATPase